MSKFKVGVIGNGFVGEAQAFAFAPTTDLRIYDIDPKKSTHTKEELDECDFVFVCVPTPMRRDGSQDLTYIDDVFENAVEGPIYIIKSTVLPKTTYELNKKYPYINIIFSPEFLTERTAKLDMLTQARIVLGGSSFLTKKVRKLFEERFMNRHQGNNRLNGTIAVMKWGGVTKSGVSAMKKIINDHESFFKEITTCRSK